MNQTNTSGAKTETGIEKLIDEERLALQAVREKADRTEDQGLKSAVAKLDEVISRLLDRLETRSSEERSREEITQQINAMFR